MLVGLAMRPSSGLSNSWTKLHLRIHSRKHFPPGEIIDVALT